MSTSIETSSFSSGGSGFVDRLLAQRRDNASEKDPALDQSLKDSQEAVSVALNLTEGRKQWARDEVEAIKRQTYDMAVIQLLDPEQYAHVISGLADRLEAASNAYSGSDSRALKADSEALAQRAEDLAEAQTPDVETPKVETPKAETRETDSATIDIPATETPSEQLARYSQAAAESDPDTAFSDTVSSLTARLKALFQLAQDKAEEANVPQERINQAATRFKNSLNTIGTSLDTIASWTSSSLPTREIAGTPLNVTV